jgi:hypothetical protein
MDRRAFFSVVRRGRLRVLELSCERLHLRWVDARGRARATTPEEAAALGEPPRGVAAATAADDAALEAGEPPARIAAEAAADLFESLERRLATADVVRVAGREWLQEDELRRGVDAALEAFERRGGRIEHERRAPSSPARALALVLGLFVLGVAPAAAQSNADEALRTRVEAALAAAADLPADSISVQVQGGVVTLSGSVACEGCGGNATPGGAGTVQQSLGAVVRAIPGVTDLRFALRYTQQLAR